MAQADADDNGSQVKLTTAAWVHLDGQETFYGVATTVPVGSDKPLNAGA
jgi:hypothetical protein